MKLEWHIDADQILSGRLRNSQELSEIITTTITPGVSPVVAHFLLRKQKERLKKSFRKSIDLEKTALLQLSMMPIAVLMED